MKPLLRLATTVCILGALLARPVAATAPSSATKILYSTYFGKDGGEAVAHGAVDSKGNLYVSFSNSEIKNGDVLSHHDLALFDKRGKLRERVRVAADREFIGDGYIALAPDLELAGRPGAAKGAVFVALVSADPDLPVRHPIQTGEDVSEDNPDLYVAAYSLDLRTLLFGTYLGGSDVDIPTDIDVAPDGTIVVVGNTASRDYPVARATQRKRVGAADGFVSVIDPRAAVALNGNGLPFSTYLGGREKKKFTGILDFAGVFAADVDTDGRIHVVGTANSHKKFPLVSPIQSRISGPSDAFLTVYDPGTATDAERGDVRSAPRILFSTFFGGSDSERAVDVDTDRAGRSVVAGVTTSEDYPLVSPAQDELAGPSDHFVTVIDSRDAAAPAAAVTATMPFSTLLGGSVFESLRLGVAVDRSGFIHLAGATQSPDFPVMQPLQRNLSTPDLSVARCFDLDGKTIECGDLYLARFGPVPTGARGRQAAAPDLEFSTFWGGGSLDALTDLVVDRRGAAHLIGSSLSENFPLHKAKQKRNVGGFDLVLVKIAR